MTFDELVAVARELVGKVIDVDITLPDADVDAAPIHLAGFAGTVDRVSPTLGGGWRIWTRENIGPSPGTVALLPLLFEGADFEADRHEEDMARVDEEGLTWTLRVRQGGVTTCLTVYLPGEHIVYEIEAERP